STTTVSGILKVPTAHQPKDLRRVGGRRVGRRAPPADSVSCIPRQPDAGELPARRRMEEIAIARAHVSNGRRARAAAQYPLPAHELAVVFAERTGGRPVARIAQVRAGCPLPNIPEHL